MRRWTLMLIGLTAAICLLVTGVAGAATSLDQLLLVRLGKRLYEDPDLSLNGNQACMTCHHPTAGFADPVDRVAPTVRPVSEGSVAGLFGGRNAPSAAYAAYSPMFHYDEEEGLFFGGVFWDGRATGRKDVTATGGLGAGPTGDTLADQAKGPFGNPVEMALGPKTEHAVVKAVKQSDYAWLFKKVFGWKAFKDEEAAYNNIALAISAFERSHRLNRFKSKFDRFIAEQGGDVSGFTDVPPNFKSRVYSREEAEGLALFNGKGQCALCHPTAGHDENTPPMLTDFSFDNLGIPENPTIKALVGVDPLPIDYGLGAQIAQLEAAFGGPVAKQMVVDGVGGQVEVATHEAGKFKVSSLRNIARTAPYGHNGYFATLYDIVHFYNTRDIADANWPVPEVAMNVNDGELGDLDLTFEEEQKIVIFLETLTDGRW